MKEHTELQTSGLMAAKHPSIFMLCSPSIILHVVKRLNDL